jgi:hypothetical protein
VNGRYFCFYLRFVLDHMANKQKSILKKQLSNVILNVYSYVKHYKLLIFCYIILAILGALISQVFVNIINTSINSALDHFNYLYSQ